MGYIKTESPGAPVRAQEPQPLAIHVAFTTEPETVAALRRAAGLASGLNARLHLVAPQVVPWAAEIDHPHVSPDFTAAKMLKLAAEAGVEADVHVVLCRDRIEGLESVLGINAVVVTGEDKLTRQLAKRGHQVLAADRFSAKKGER